MLKQPPQHPDTSMDIIVGFCAVVVAALALWYAFHEQIATFMRDLRLLEIQLVEFVINDGRLKPVAVFLVETPPKAMTVEQLVLVSERVGRYLRFPVAAALVSMAICIMLRHPLERFKRTFTMASLAAYTSGDFPHTRIAVGKDIHKQSIHEGPWAMGVTAWRFARQHNLVVDNSAQGTFVLDRERARAVFVKQLGPLWTGPEALSEYAQALLIVFCLRIQGSKDQAMDILEELARSAAADHQGCPNPRAALARLDEVSQSPQVRVLLDAHAYTYPLFMTLLEAARADGILPSADFLWLKPLDRRLWYTLNNVGRPVAWIEVAGIKAQWLAEKQARKPLYRPMVEEAISGLDEELHHTLEDRNDA